MSVTVAKQLADGLKHHIGQGPGTVSVDGDGVSVAVDVEQCERYAVGVRGIVVRPDQPASDVRDVAERIVRDVTELDGPLAVVEYDARQGRAIVRSAQPETDDAGVTYWEGDVRADEASLQRYRKDHSAPEREAVAEPLMHNIVGRVAEQLADATRQVEQ